MGSHRLYLKYLMELQNMLITFGPWGNYRDNILGAFLTWGTIPNNRLRLRNGLIKELIINGYHLKYPGSDFKV